MEKTELRTHYSAEDASRIRQALPNVKPKKKHHKTDKLIAKAHRKMVQTLKDAWRAKIYEQMYTDFDLALTGSFQAKFGMVIEFPEAVSPENYMLWVLEQEELFSLEQTTWLSSFGGIFTEIVETLWYRD